MDKFYDHDLRQYLCKQQPLGAGLNVEDFTKVFECVRDGLEHMQSNPTNEKYMHLDLKPANIMVQVEEVNGKTRLKHVAITDFGLARLEDPGDTQLMIRPGYNKLGTSPYNTAPDSRYSHKFDVWAFGMILYEVAFGGTPYRQEIDKWHKSGQADLPELTGDLEHFRNAIQTCLDVNAETRSSSYELSDF